MAEAAVFGQAVSGGPKMLSDALPDAPTSTLVDSVEPGAEFSANVRDMYTPNSATVASFQSLVPAVPAMAQDAAPASPEASDDQPSFMKYLAARGEHNIENESWNAYSQFTYIYAWKKAFQAPYTNLNGSTNSLYPTAEQSFTGSATLYAAARLWHGAEVYAVPELISERPLSQLKGLGGAIQDFELQKGGAETPTLYLSRLYLRQTFEFGGTEQHQDSAPMQLGTTYKSRRLVFEFGSFSVLDFFDKSAFDIDPRRGFLNLAFMTYAAYDFASDARGYSRGIVSEFYWDDWAVRVARTTPPEYPNQLQTDWRIWKYYGEQFELEHDHKWHGQDGIIRVLGFRNHEWIGKFSDAVGAFDSNPQENATTCTGFNYGSNNATAPDLCWARKPNNKLGIGMFGEQNLVKDLGIFARGMYADGKTEVDAYTSTDRSLDVGLVGTGSLWSRPRDVTGIGLHLGWISNAHSQYLGMGGIDGFVGDGAISPGPEGALDMFYNLNFHKTFWLAGDYQHVTNPAFNSARGPVNLFLVKIHGEF